ncbi:MAG: PAS domain-containing protein [Candidatus Hadarchaeum sp.]|uniref:PAS domain-containing protein n=1 Tax=Candidatus Hadarchaeum sp. TaxID=2883567 RepID=UPI003D0F2B98
MELERSRLILDGIQELIAYQDLENRVLWANKVSGDSVGLAPEKLVGRFCYEIWHRRDRPCEGCPVVKARETGQPQEAEITTPDGRVWYIRGYPVRDERGRVLGVIEITHEITERKQLELEMQKARELAEGIVDTVREPLLVLDADLKVVSANRTFYQTFKVTAEETEGRRIYELGNRQWDIPRLRELLEEIIPPNTFFENFEVEHDFPNIGRRIMLLNARRIHTKTNKTLLILLALEDITERRRSERALSESEEKYRSLVESSDDSIYLLDRELRFLFANRAALNRLGLTSEQVLGKSFAEIYSAEAAERLAEAVKRVLETGKPVQQEHWSERLHGAFLRTLSPVRDPNSGEVTAITVVSKEITSLKMMEASLREAGERLKAIIDFSPDAIIITDLQYKIIDCNLFALKLLDIESKEELIGRDMLGLISPQTRNEIVRSIQEAMETGVVRDVRHELMNGYRIPAEISVSAVPDATGKPSSLVFVIKDITEQEREKERRREFIYRVNNISPGDCCLHNSHQALYNIFAQLTLQGVPGICFTREKPEDLAKFGITRDKVVVISSVPLAGYETLDGLQQVSLRIAEFLKENRKSVVLLDGLEYLVSRWGFDTVYRFLQEKRFSFLESEAVLLVPVNLSAFSDRERALISTELKVIG